MRKKKGEDKKPEEPAAKAEEASDEATETQDKSED
jgi:hypothetical protein